MPDLTRPDRPVAEAHLRTPGGFAWWYADLIDAAGSGAVLIWSFGLPFLPGVLSAARAGRPRAALERPAIYLVTFDRGCPSFVLFEELEPGCVTEGVGRWSFGSSTVAWDGRRLVADLRTDMAGVGPVVARLEAEGTPRRPSPEEPATGAYSWSPLLVGTGRVVWSCAGQHQEVVGAAYLDRNSAGAPIDRLGFSAWTWGRVSVGDRTRIWYVSWPDGGGPPARLGVEICADGTTHVPTGLALDSVQVRRSRWGFQRVSALRMSLDGSPWIEAEELALVDDSPFYARQTVRTPSGGLGVAETCRPGSLDRAVSRWMVSLCVTRSDRVSIWHPLFAGPSRGRWARWARWAAAGAGMGS